MPDDSKLETIPVGSLGIIAHKSIVPLGEKVDSYIVKWRKNRQNENKSSIVFHGYEKTLTLSRQTALDLVQVRQRVLSTSQSAVKTYISCLM